VKRSFRESLCAKHAGFSLRAWRCIRWKRRHPIACFAIANASYPRNSGWSASLPRVRFRSATRVLTVDGGCPYHRRRRLTRYHPGLSTEHVMNRARPWLLGAFLLIVPAGAVEQVQPKEKILRVAVVITPESSGLLRQLLADFENS